MRENVEKLINLYQHNLYATALNVCKNPEDAEDIIQDVFITYHTSNKEFESAEHIKSWLLRVTINKARNNIKTFWNINKTSLEDYMETLTFENKDESDLFESVMKLPYKYRIVIHLYYYEEYSASEIAGILKISTSNVNARLSRGRSLLKKMMNELKEEG